jgi:hypothetical protein
MKKVYFYRERWMKSYEIYDSYKNLGSGTLFGVDSEYVSNFEDIVERILDEIDSSENNIDTSKIEIIGAGWCEVFVKNLDIRFGG